MTPAMKSYEYAAMRAEALPEDARIHLRKADDSAFGLQCELMHANCLPVAILDLRHHLAAVKDEPLLEKHADDIGRIVAELDAVAPALAGVLGSLACARELCARLSRDLAATLESLAPEEDEEDEEWYW